MTPTPAVIPAIDVLSPVRATQARTQQAMESLRDQMNASAISAYQGQYAPWAQNYLNAHATLASMPVPAMALVVAQFMDPTSGPGTVGTPYGVTPIFWAVLVQGTLPVCPALPVPVLPPPVSTQVFLGNGQVMNVPPGDVMPIGWVITGPDGGLWIKTANPGPFGIYYYYARQNPA